MTDPEPSTAVDDTDGPTPSAARPRPRWVLVLPWVLAVVALAAAVWTTLQWQQLAGRQAQVDSARSAAVAFASDLTNWDASDGLDDEIEVLRNQGTGPFLDEVATQFGGGQLTQELATAEMSATGRVEEAFVQELEGDIAEVFTVVTVQYRSAALDQDSGDVSMPAVVVLERVDGRWLVREVTLPNSQQIGQLMNPSAGD